MGHIVLSEQTAASVQTPASGKLALFNDSADGIFKVKDEADVVRTLGAQLAGIRTISGTTDTPTVADVGFLLLCTNAAGCAITIDGAVFAARDCLYAVGTQDQVSFVEGSGSMAIETPETLLTEKAYAMAGLVFTGSAAAILCGKLEPV